MKKPNDIKSYLRSHLLSRTEYYDLYSQLDDLSCGARIVDINIIDITYDKSVDGRTGFHGVLLIKAVKEVGVTSSSFTGVFDGSFDEEGVYLESASLDVSSTSSDS